MDSTPIVSLFPTIHPDVNDIVQELQSGIQTVLGEQLVGLYLEGSLAAGGFDAASDIDFLAVMNDDIAPDLFASLQVMHDRLNGLDNPWATRLEGMYSSRADLRSYDPTHAAFPNLERGVGERLKMVHYDETGVIHRWILRQYGVVLRGPPLKTLIDPVTPDDLRQAVRAILPGWAKGLLADPYYLQMHDYQCYVVLSACRMLYTVRHGEVVPKVASANWAKKSLPERWGPLIERAWIGRMASKGQAPLEDIQCTLDFLRYMLEQLVPGNDLT
jgi:hypothetical protein